MKPVIERPRGVVVQDEGDRGCDRKHARGAQVLEDSQDKKGAARNRDSRDPVKPERAWGKDVQVQMGSMAQYA